MQLLEREKSSFGQFVVIVQRNSQPFLRQIRSDSTGEQLLTRLWSAYRTTTGGNMKVSTLKKAAAVGAVAVLAGVGLAPATTADQLGTNSLAAVLTATTPAFDNNWNDYDVVTAAVLAVLTNKPNSAVGVLADGTVALTAFIPNDKAFRDLAREATRTKVRTEEEAFNIVASLGIDAVEAVLLYHVVPGATIGLTTAVGANGAELQTALAGATFRVKVSEEIELKDVNRKLDNPEVLLSQTDINAGNKQIAHGIDEVLMPVYLPGQNHRKHDR